MLGEPYGESKGKRTVRRVVSVEPAKIEVCFEESGTLLGVATTGVGTYTSELRSDGTLYGEGQGVLMSQEGDAVTWKGSGQGKFLPNGGASFRGILYYRTGSKKLAKLNAAPGVFEHEVDAQGNTHSKTWEWK